MINYRTQDNGGVVHRERRLAGSGRHRLPPHSRRRRPGQRLPRPCPHRHPAPSADPGARPDRPTSPSDHAAPAAELAPSRRARRPVHRYPHPTTRSLTSTNHPPSRSDRRQHSGDKLGRPATPAHPPPNTMITKPTTTKSDHPRSVGGSKISVPRDRNGSFEPKIVPKRARRLGQIDEMILVIGVDVEGRKHALGCWIAEAEGAKFWLSVLTQLRSRGLRDILICCCDGLSAPGDWWAHALRPRQRADDVAGHGAGYRVDPVRTRDRVTAPVAGLGNPGEP